MNADNEQEDSVPVMLEEMYFYKLGICLLLLFFSVSATLFAAASKNGAESYPYNTYAMPCSVEAIKLFVSATSLQVSNS